MKRVCSFVLMAAIGLGGCLWLAPTTVFAKKGDKHFQQGLQHELTQEWEKAVDEFSLAVAANPASMEYQIHFRRAKFNASQLYTSQARALAGEGDYGKAYHALRQAYGFEPNQLALAEMTEMLRLQKAKEETSRSAADNNTTRGLKPGPQSTAQAQEAVVLQRTKQMSTLESVTGVTSGSVNGIGAKTAEIYRVTPRTVALATNTALPPPQTAQFRVISYSATLPDYISKVPNPPRAQEGGTILSGIAEDPTGATIPGERVTLFNKTTRESLTTQSDDSGQFTFNNVEPGDYTLKGEAEGFKTQVLAITVGTKPLTNIKLKMEISISEDVTVFAAQPELSENNAAAVNFSNSMLGYLPTQTQDILPVLSNFLFPAAMGANGPSVLVDGVEGGDLTLPSSGIKDVFINKNPYSVEYRRPGLGRIEVITKDGTRKHYEGNMAAYFRNSGLSARNAFAMEKPDLNMRLLETVLLGPLPYVKRTSFFLSANRLMDDNSAVVNADTLSGPLMENVPTFKGNTRLLGRIDWKPNKLNRINLTYNFFDQSQRNRGVGGLRLAEQGFDSNRSGHKFQATVTTAFSPSLLNTFRFSFRRQKQRVGNIAEEPAIRVKGAFTGGPSQTATSEQETKAEFQDVATYNRGNHTFRFGGAFKPQSTNLSDETNFGGTFTFSNLSDFAAGLPTLFQIVQGTPDLSYSQNEGYGFVQDEIKLSKNSNLMLGVRYEWQSRLNDHTNFAPRLGFAFAPGDQKTVFRFGAGIFYDQLPDGAIQQSLLIDGAHTRELVIEKPTFPDPFQGGSVNATEPSIWRLAPDIKSPYLLQGTFGVERKLNNTSQLTLEYQTVRGLHLFRARNVNAPFGGTLPDPKFGLINQVESSGRLRSNAVIVTLQGELINHLKGMAQYTLARTSDDTSDPFEPPANNYDLRPEWGRSALDKRHRFSFAGAYSLPRDFKIAAVLLLATGLPYDISTGFDDNGDGVVNDRPPGVTRNTGLEPGYAQLDLRLSKFFVIPTPLSKELKPGKRFRNLVLNVDMFNVLNRNNRLDVIGNLSSPRFGRPNASAQARTTQLSFKYSF